MSDASRELDNCFANDLCMAEIEGGRLDNPCADTKRFDNPHEPAHEKLTQRAETCQMHRMLLQKLQRHTHGS